MNIMKKLKVIAKVIVAVVALVCMFFAFSEGPDGSCTWANAAGMAGLALCVWAMNELGW